MSGDNGPDQEIVAMLKILSQKSLPEQLCPIYPGDNIIGRASDNAVVISDKTISKKHACILVEGREHFVKDCSSKNKTYRRSAELRPEAYYELCNDLEMTFGEVKCQYLISSSTELPEAMDVDATVPYDVADAVRVDSRGPTPDLTTSSKSFLEGEEERDGGGETVMQTEDATGTNQLPEKTGDQTLLCGHGVRDAGDDNLSPPASPQLLGSPGFLSPPTAAESSDSPVDREGSAAPQGNLEDATPFKQTLLLEDETPDTCIPTEPPNTTSSEGERLQDASTLDYSSTGTAGGRAERRPQQQQGLREAAVGETVPYGHAEAVAPTVPYSTDVGIEPTLPYPQGEGVVDPTVPYGVGPFTGPAREVQQTVPYNLSDEETDIEDEGECEGDERAAKIPIEQTVPYHLDEEEPAEGEGDKGGEEDNKKQLHCSETAKEVEVVKASADSPHSDKRQPPKSETEDPFETVQGSSVPSQDSGTASRVNKAPSPIKPESPDIQLAEDPFEFPKDSEASSLPMKPTKKGRKGSGPGKNSRVARKTNNVVAAIAESSQEPLSSPASSLNEEPLSSRAKRRKPAKVPPSTPVVIEEPSAVQTSQEDTTPTSRGRGVKGKGRAKKTATPLATPKASASPVVEMGTPSKLSDVEANSGDKPCVLFTGVTDDEAQKVIASLGGKMAASVYECTHLVTDKMRRTVKFLCCLARGCHIVNFKWVDKCKTQRRFVNPSPFVIKDKSFEKQHSFTLTQSRDKAAANPGGILSGYNFVLSPRVKPDHEQLGDIIRCIGGSVVSTLPDTLSARHLVLSAEEDATMFAEDERKGVPVYSTEFLFAAVLKQELELTQHRLTCSNGKDGRKAASRKTPTRKRSADSETSCSSRSKRKPK